MEQLQRTQSKIIKTHLKWQISLYEIEAQIIQFTNLPIQTPGLHLIAQEIHKKFLFMRNFITAETLSNNSIPDDLLEIQKKLVELEAEFEQSDLNLHGVDDYGSEVESVCESCLNDDQGEEMLCEDEVMVPELVCDSAQEKVGETTLAREKVGKRRRRWWWRTVVILMPASVVVMAVSYFEKMQQRQGMVTPT